MGLLSAPFGSGSSTRPHPRSPAWSAVLKEFVMIVGAVLAAGAGTRYGMPKIAAQQGKWLRSAVAALAVGGCDEVVVAMGARVVEPPPGASALIVDQWSAGMSATVTAVLEYAQSRPDIAGAVLHVVDMPDVGPPVISRVVEAAGRRNDSVARAVYGGQPGHPVYLGVDHFAGVRAVLKGDVGAQRYLAGRTDVRLVECSDLASGIDRDTRGQCR